MEVHFYSHLIEIESIIIELDKLDLTDSQKLRLSKLIDSSIHHTIMDVILAHLSDKDKIVFLQHLSSGKHDKIWQVLNEKIENIEEKIIKTVDELKKELHKDIKEARKRS